ncbi:hypothetical protein J1605_000567 [Eschrichtius robustus]|uniref:Uncharacterized protein n=1 Tax=Eschrichtius robustus TaxID=9764 RepID=A0AB34GTE9_ESCRO|nr:hypothetical protein J1605_000567 [Eschrichtius robustus]
MAALNFKMLSPKTSESPLTPPFSHIPNSISPPTFKIYPKSENLVSFHRLYAVGNKPPRSLPRMTAVVPSLVPPPFCPHLPAFSPVHSQMNLLTSRELSKVAATGLLAQSLEQRAEGGHVTSLLDPWTRTGPETSGQCLIPSSVGLCPPVA